MQIVHNMVMSHAVQASIVFLLFTFVNSKMHWELPVASYYFVLQISIKVNH